MADYPMVKISNDSGVGPRIEINGVDVSEFFHNVEIFSPSADSTRSNTPS